MICIIDCGTTYIDNIKAYVNKWGFSTKVVSLKRLKSANFKSFSGAIITGGATLLSQIDNQKFTEPFKRLFEADIPVLGICLGHQIMGLLFGAEIFHDELIGQDENIGIIKKDPIFSNIKTGTFFHEEHLEYISLPKDFFLLANSKTCNNEAMKHKNKILYGVQFHPEVSGIDGEILFKNFLKMCSPLSSVKI